jgi:tetratricopeptide (TPR) repeat protein
VALACQGLGNVALANAQPLGAEAWYGRAVRFADDVSVAAELALGLAEVARLRGQTEIALGRLERARDTFAMLGDSEGLARVLLCEGRLEAAQGRHQHALRSFREALGRLRDTHGRHALEITVGREISLIHLEDGRLPDAEDEVRRAEELAVARNLTRELARLYLILGAVRSRQGNESGFIFFENAIELCRGLEPARDLEAESYLEYSRFRRATGEADEANAYLDRAREILEPMGDSPLLTKVRAELEEHHNS